MSTEPRMTTRETARGMHIPDAIRSFTVTHGYAPTVKELAERIGKSVGWTHAALVSLRRDGYVEWESGVPRTLRLPKVTLAGKAYGSA